MPDVMQIGSLIENRWEIHDIRHGGMGIVYIVYDNVNSEPLAAKTFREEVFNLHPNIADSFQREALVWLDLDVHPNITQARFVQTINGRPYLFLEYVSGGDLRGLIGRGRLAGDFPQVLRFAIQFCDGMSHALSKGVKAHRDIKPRNCLITLNKTLKVTDFGLARVFDDIVTDDGADEHGGILGRLFGRTHVESKPRRDRSAAKKSGITKTPTVTSAGSPPYMAPELFDDALRASVRTDIYSTGVMLYQMVTGRLPFMGNTREEFERLHKTKPHPPLPPSIPQPLKSVIRKCLSKDPDRRYADFGELRGELSTIYEDLAGEPAPHAVVGKELDAEQWHEKGMSLIALGRESEGVDCFNRAVATNPRYDEAWCSKGAVLRESGQIDDAIECYANALEVNPGNTEAWNAKGELLMQSMSYEDAIGCFDRALELSQQVEMFFGPEKRLPGDAGGSVAGADEYDPGLESRRRVERTWRNKGKALLNLGKREEALGCFRKALESNSNDAQAWLNIGLIMGQLGRVEDELSCFDRAIDIDPEFLEALNSKGIAFSRIGKYKEAFECFERALKVNPRYERALYNKGAVLAKMGWLDEACICFDCVLALDAEYTDAWMGKGFALAAQGNRDEAIDCFREAEKLGDPTAAKMVEKHSEGLSEGE